MSMVESNPEREIGLNEHGQIKSYRWELAIVIE